MNRRQRTVAPRLARIIGPTLPLHAVEQLLDRGLLDLRACERHIVADEIRRLETRGLPRCGAMHVVADELGCSYAKVRTLYYETFKQPKR